MFLNNFVCMVFLLRNYTKEKNPFSAQNQTLRSYRVYSRHHQLLFK